MGNLPLTPEVKLMAVLRYLTLLVIEGISVIRDRIVSEILEVRH